MAINFLIAAIVAITAGASYYQAKKAQREAKKAADAMAGVLLNKESNIEPLPVIYGERRVGGVRVYFKTSPKTVNDNKNKYLYICLALCEGEVESITDIRLDDIPITDSKFYKNGRYYWTYQTFLGSDTQSASTLLQQSGSEWTAEHKLSGVAYIAMRLEWNENIYSGMPDITAVVKGKKVYDPRTSTTAWSDNPALCIRDYLLSDRYGKGLPTSAIDEDAFEAAADDCDSFTVTPYSGASAGHKLFRMNAVIDTGKELFENVQQMLLACRAFMPYTKGKYALKIDQATTSSLTLNTDTIIGGIEIIGTKKEDKFNRVITKFPNPNTEWQPDTVAYPVDGDPAGVNYPLNGDYITVSGTDYAAHDYYSTQDGGTLLVDEVELEYITDYYAARDLARIFMLRSRDSIRVGLQATSEAMDLNVGDVVSITHPTPAWTEKPFQVEGINLNYDGTVTLALIEYNSSIYAYDPANEEATYPDTTLPDPYDVETPANPSTTPGTTEGGDGTIYPTIDVEWDDIEDSFLDFYQVDAVPQNGSPVISLRVKEATAKIVITDTTTDYDIKITAQNSLGVKSEPLTISNITPVIDTTAPGVPDNVSATGTLKQIILTWDNPTDADFKHVEIYRSATNTAPGSETAATFKNDGEELVDGGYTGEITRYYWVRSVDTSGNKSAWVASGAATTVLAVTNDLGDDIVTADKILANTITSNEIDANSIASAVITAGSIIVSGDNISDLNNDSGFNNTYIDGNGDIQGVSSGAGTSVDNTLNAGKTLALLLNESVSGVANSGECALVAVDNEGNIDRTTDGYILWNGSKITVDRYQYASAFTVLTMLANKRGFICFDTTKSDPFTVESTAMDVAFVYKQGEQWYYDNNTSTPVSFTPSNDLVALGWLETGVADSVVRGGLFGEPVSLTTASFPSDVIESGTVGGIKIEPTKLYEGTGTFNNSNTGFYLDSSGQFSLKNKLSFDGTDLTVDGGVKATTLDVIDATITGTLNASSVSAGSIKVESLSQGVWNAIDDRFAVVAGSSGGFYETDDSIFVGSEITIATPQVAHNTKDIVFQIAIDQYWASTVNRTGTALQATVTFEYSTDNSTWYTVSSGGSNATTTITATNYPFSYGGESNYIYYLLSGYQFTMAYAELAAGNYYFRVRITPAAATNAFQLASYLPNGGIPVTYEANEAVSGTVSTSGNANTLDGLDSTQFLRSDADDSTSGSLSVGGNLTVTGDLTVNGTTTTLNTATLDVEDKNITLNYGAGDTSASANGAGITIQDAVDASTDASILWDATNDEFDFSHSLNSPYYISTKNVATTASNGTFATSKTLTGNIHITNGAGASGSPKEAAITFQGSDAAQSQAGIYVVNDNSSGTHMALATTESYAVGPQIGLSITNSGVVNFPRARPTYNGNGLWSFSDFSSTNVSNWNTAYTYSQVGHLPLSGGTIAGTLTVTSTNDVQIYLNGNGSTWAGIAWTDSGGTDYLWFNGANKTFAIGGGGSSVSGKKLHVDGGTTIGSAYDSVTPPTDGLYVQGDIKANTNLWQYNNSTDAHLGLYSANGAKQRADSRDESTFARTHWYGVSSSGGTSNFRHAWYDGNSYVNVTAENDGITFTGTLNPTLGYQVNGTTVIDSSRNVLGVRGRFTTAVHHGSLGYWKSRDNSSGSQYVLEYSTSDTIADANIKWMVNSSGDMHLDGKEVFNGGDSYLRFNQSNTWGNGIWIGSSNFLASSGYIAAGSNGGTTSSRVYIASGSYNGTNVIALDGADGSVKAQSYKIGSTAIIDSSRSAYLENITFGDSIQGNFFSGKVLGGSGIASSYDERVVLLCPKVETNTSWYNIVDGKISALKTGGNVCDTFDVFCHSVYNDSRATFTSRGQRTGHKLVTCTYGGIKWIAIKFDYTANPYNYLLFHGIARTNVTDHGDNQLKVISYYDQQSTGTVLNSEIYNSIADYEPSATSWKTAASDYGFYNPSGVSRWALINSGGIDIQSGGLEIGGTSVINSSRNLTNIGTYNGSGLLTLTNTSNSHLRIAYNGSYYWNIYREAATGDLVFDSSNAAGEFVRFDAVDKTVSAVGGYLVNGTTVIDSSRNLTNVASLTIPTANGSTGIGITSDTAVGGGSVLRINKGAADKQGYISFDADQLYLGVPNNTTNANIGTKGGVALNLATNYATRISISSGGDVNVVSGALKFNGTSVIDSSRNLTNIGSISSGGISASGGLTVTQGSDLNLQAGSNQDIGDIVYRYYDGSEKHRLWDGGSNGLLYRYNGTGSYRIGVNTNTNSLAINGTTVIDSSRNLTNIGTIYANGSNVWSDGGNQGTAIGTIHIDPASATDHAGGAITFGASDASNGTNAQAGIYIRSDGSYGTKMYLATTDSYAQGAKTALSIDHSGHITANRGSLTVAGNIIKSGGTSAQFLKADGSVQSTSASSPQGTLSPFNATNNTLSFLANVSHLNGLITGSQTSVLNLSTGELQVTSQGELNIKANSITATKIAASTITGDKIAATGIITSTAQINDAVISGAKIANLAVDTIKIADQAVTIPSAAFTASGVTVATVSSVFTTWVTIQSITWTSTGADTLMNFYCDGSSNNNKPAAYAFRILFNGSVLTQLGEVSMEGDNRATANRNFTISRLLYPTSGSNTITIQAAARTVGGGSSSATMYNRTLSTLEVKK